jgi:hypothetical protein
VSNQGDFEHIAAADESKVKVVGKLRLPKNKVKTSNGLDCASSNSYPTDDKIVSEVYTFATDLHNHQ